MLKLVGSSVRLVHENKNEGVVPETKVQNTCSVPLEWALPALPKILNTLNLPKSKKADYAQPH
jgi:hypothetical protein